MFARHFIDSLDFARNGREMSGVVPLSEMSRLRDMLDAADGEVSFDVHGFPDRDGKPVLEVTVAGICRLRCQRCLNGFDYPLKLVASLVLVSPDEMDMFAEDEFEDADAIPADKHLDIVNMVEEEILLSLPFAPMHPPGACQPAAGSSGSADRNPFSVLAGLKDKQL